MITNYLRKNKKKAYHYGYRPDEIKQTENFNSADITFCMCSIAPQNLLQFSLGSDIIFNIARKRKDVFADMAVLLDKKIFNLTNKSPITALYSCEQVRDFDIIGLSSYYVGSYFNIVPFLMMCGIEPFALKRNCKNLIIAGGGAVSSNPEPIASFFDVIIIGDGETPINILFDIKVKYKEKSNTALLKIIRDSHSSFYIPSLKKTTSIVFNTEKNIDDYILGADDYVSKPNNKTIEITRGCFYKCRFCSLGQMRKKAISAGTEVIIKKIQSYPEGTTIYPFAPDESSYSHYGKIIENLGNRKLFRYNQRFDSYLKYGRYSQSDYRVVFGLDGISQRIRDIVKKKITLDEIYNSIEHVFKNFEIMKLNIVIAYPFEKNEDWQEFDNFLDSICRMRLELIPDKCLTNEENILIRNTYYEAKIHNQKLVMKNMGIDKKLFMIHLAPTPFQPEPHTPMQWESMGNIELACSKIKLLQKKYIKKYGMIKIEGLNSPQNIKINYILKRGDRNIADVLYALASAGIYNSSGINPEIFSHLNMQLKKHQIDPSQFYKQIPFSSNLVWDFIKTGLENYYKSEYIQMSKGIK